MFRCLVPSFIARNPFFMLQKSYFDLLTGHFWSFSRISYILWPACRRCNSDNGVFLLIDAFISILLSSGKCSVALEQMRHVRGAFQLSPGPTLLSPHRRIEPIEPLCSPSTWPLLDPQIPSDPGLLLPLILHDDLLRTCSPSYPSQAQPSLWPTFCRWLCLIVLIAPYNCCQLSQNTSNSCHPCFLHHLCTLSCII